jgi:hypothetical protein
MGEYDQTKSYTAGQTFSISTPLTITISEVNYVIAAGYWGVPPAATAVDAQGWGPYAGSLPANPTTAGINIPLMFFNPENITGTVPIPPFSAAPNGKFYARMIVASCGNA